MKYFTRGILLVAIALVLGLASTVEAARERFAAVAYSPGTGRWGYGSNYSTKAEALARARRECGQSDARTMWCRNAWIALAISDRNRGGWGAFWASTAGAARAGARRECLARNADARVVVCVSAWE